MSGVNVELRIVRLVATLGFFFNVVMAIVTIQGHGNAWGYGVGAALLGFMAAYLWKDDLVAQSNLREQQKTVELNRSQRGYPMFPGPPNQSSTHNDPGPPAGPGSPIQRSG